MREVLEKLDQLYDKAPSINDWVPNNLPDGDLIYKSGTSSQHKYMLGVAYVLGLDNPRVLGHHSSKSVKLPVSTYHYRDNYGTRLYAMIRDNFHDLNCLIFSLTGITLDPFMVYPSVSMERFKETFKEATNGIYSDRYVNAKIDDTEWYKNYTGNSIYNKDGRLYVAGSTYMEGIEDIGENIGLLKAWDSNGHHYKDDCNYFVFRSGSYAHTTNVIQQSIRAAQNSAYQIHKKEREKTNGQART